MHVKWSTIAAQLPGRTDNEIKNYWNTHLKKRLLRMGINPDTFAPASPSSSSATAAAATSACAGASATRHMAQWESARLEAEARLSRESLLFSSAAAASASGSSATASADPSGDDLAGKPDSDFFLRIWNSEVGDAFRLPLSRPAGEMSSGSAPAVAAKVEDGVAPSASSVEGEVPSGPDSSSSNEMDENSDESYQLFLNFAGDDLGLFHGHLGGISFFSGDLNDVSLDTAFK